MNETTTPLEQIVATRKEKVENLRKQGINPYPAKFAVKSTTAELQESFKALAVGDSGTDQVTVAGRMTSRRDMGKASFADITDSSGKIQLYFKADIIGADSFKVFKDYLDIADFIGVTGTPFRTRTGELSLKVERWTLLSKALRPLPEKWHGLKDTETRYRQRYLDLKANKEVKNIFIQRSTIISTLRQELEARGFLEVETPMMQTIPGGAAARPFTTHHNALGMELFLRIAPELYLKRLVVGGMDRVYEVGRNFRNEGIDRTHNPEFTMLELYQAYADFGDMMDLCEHLILSCAAKIGATIPSPFKRLRLFDLIKTHTGMDLQPPVAEGRYREAAQALNIDLPENTPEKKILDHIFDKMVQPHLTEPTFVTEYPSLYSPLAKSRPGKPEVSERFELFIQGREVANAYSELNDPQEQKRRFEEQVADKIKGDDEAQPYDEDYITALEHGLPPTGGLGIGVDRLIMALCNIDSVREVILFPLMREE